MNIRTIVAITLMSLSCQSAVQSIAVRITQINNFSDKTLYFDKDLNEEEMVVSPQETIECNLHYNLSHSGLPQRGTLGAIRCNDEHEEKVATLNLSLRGSSYTQRLSDVPYLDVKLTNVIRLVGSKKDETRIKCKTLSYEEEKQLNCQITIGTGQDVANWKIEAAWEESENS